MINLKSNPYVSTDKLISLSPREQQIVDKIDDCYLFRMPFSMAVHQRRFINYLEVIITEDGNIHYATPSHQEFLLNLIQQKEGISREELWESVSPYDYGIEWLHEKTKAILVWTTHYVGELNALQRNTLEKLKYHELYNGTI